MQFALLFLFVAIVSAPIALGHGDLHVLIDAASKKVETAPSDPFLLLERANLIRQHGQFDKALADLEKVAALDPTIEDRHILRAKIEIARENWSAAKTALNAFLIAQPKSSEGYYLRSKTRLALNNGIPNVQSLNDAKNAIDFQDKPPLDYHLNYIRLLTLNGDNAAVEKAFHNAQNALGKLPALESVHADWLSKSGRPEMAAAIYSDLRRTTPTLAFHWWVEEAAMWRVHDAAKSKTAEHQAITAWDALPKKIRTRPAMIEKHDQFIESLSSLNP